MKKYEFTNELTEKAMNIYSNSDFTFYKENNIFFCGYNSKEKPFEIGSLKDVEEYLLQYE